ncbi:MAG: hypothetical protein R3F43_31910 [bacterium]
MGGARAAVGGDHADVGVGAPGADRQAGGGEGRVGVRADEQADDAIRLGRQGEPLAEVVQIEALQGRGALAGADVEAEVLGVHPQQAARQDHAAAGVQQERAGHGAGGQAAAVDGEQAVQEVGGVRAADADDGVGVEGEECRPAGGAHARAGPISMISASERPRKLAWFMSPR